MLFVVESDPLDIGRIFTQSPHIEMICVPFTGGSFFDRVVRSLTTNKLDVITMEYPLTNHTEGGGGERGAIGTD